MRGLTKLAAAASSSRPAAALAASYSTFGGSGGAGGRGRGRGSGPPPPNSARPPLGQSDPVASFDDADEPFAPQPFGHGRGRPPLPSSPSLPSYPNFMSSLKPSPSPSPSAGRGRGQQIPPPVVAEKPLPSDAAAPPSDSDSKTPIFFKRDVETYVEDGDGDDAAFSAPRGLPGAPSGVGRGKPTRVPEKEVKENEENRHLRRKAPAVPPKRPAGEASVAKPVLGQEEAIKKAMEVLNRGGRGGGRGGRGGGRGRGRGRGRSARNENEDVDMGIYLGDNADGERFQQRMGEEKMKMLDAAFDEMSYDALPSMLDEAYLDALHTNNMIEYEPEYLVDFDNPDIDEKPPMSLEEALDKARPFLMAYEGMKNHEEWEEAVKDVMERLPALKELMDMYCGPDRVTAKQQQQELERVAKTLPANVPSSVKSFTDRAVLSLQSNPGWGWDKKCQFMDKLVWEVQKHYK